MKNIFCTLLISSILLAPVYTSAQTTTIVDSTRRDTVIVIPGLQYKRGPVHRLFWGRDYRKVWSTPVSVPRLNLDKKFGGLTPQEEGGGKQTRNLRFKSAAGREYAIRSVDKRYGKSLPDELLGTFIQDLVDDQMSSAFPYGGLVAKVLSAAAGIYSTNPELYFVGDDPRLDTFRKEYANQLYTLEDRPGSDNAKYYNATDVIETEELLEEMQKDPSAQANQEAFVKARIFDLLIGDWDRHHDQWEWAKQKINGQEVYTPLPKDRDQAFSSWDGIFVKMATKAGRIQQMQPFRETIKNVKGFTWFYQRTDMPLTNEATLDTWQRAAREIQQAVTDAVIDSAVRQVPAEVFAISGAELIEKLRSRRNDLENMATDFYKTLSKDVDVPASKKPELIRVTAEPGGNLRLTISQLENDKASAAPYYSRTFHPDETSEVRVFGLGGNDRFIAEGENSTGIKVRFIGGDDKDEYNVPAAYGGRVIIYDNKENSFNTAATRLLLSQDSAVHKYDRVYKADEFRVVPLLGYTNEDRLYVGLGLRIVNHAFRKTPYGSRNELGVKYSVTQKAFSYGYKGSFIKAIGNWNLSLLAEYDEVRDQDFFGVGNNTVKSIDQRHYYRYRNKEANGVIGFDRKIGRYQVLRISGIYQMIQLLQDTARFIATYPGVTAAKDFGSKHFAGLRLEYDWMKINDSLVPASGIRFNAGAEYVANLGNENSIRRYTGMFGFVFPLGPFTIASKVGAAALSGEPEFYQLNRIGGGNTLRGYTRFRLYGKTAVYNQNELQLNFNVQSYLFNGKMGFLALLDNGRVWQPGEDSNKWYTAVGGGLMIAPFNKISITATYAVSNEDKRFAVRLGHFLK